MTQIITRRNRLFIINKEHIKSTNKEEICNALYAAIYTKFIGASKNPNFKGLNALQMLNQVNEYANLWLKERGLL